MAIIKTTSYAFLILIASTLFGCEKDQLDFDSSTYFGICAILDSSNCNVECGNIADCEGKTIRVKGKLDESNINESDFQFFLIDEKKEKFNLEIKVIESINNEVFQKLIGKGGQIFLVEGLMEGYDAPTNANCKRQFILRVEDPSQVKLE